MSHKIFGQKKTGICLRKKHKINTITQGITELRNSYGTGHGKLNINKGLQPRHAKLAVGAASTLSVFLAETHKVRNTEKDL